MLVNKYTYTPVSRESVDGKRHYCLPDGSKVPSVTTILSKTAPKEKMEALQRWRKSIGEAKAQAITTEAANRGTRMHSWLEKYVLNGNLEQPGSNPYSQQSYNMAWRIIEEGMVGKIDEYWAVEAPLYVSGLYAGTTDLVGVWRGKPAIMDFKQTNKPKKSEHIDDYRLQLAAYALAHNEMFGTEIETGVVLMCSADLLYQEFVVEGEEFKHWTNEWLKRVEQYYNIC